MSAAASIARSLQANRPSPFTCPISSTGRRPRRTLLFSPGELSCRPRFCCVLRVIPFRSTNSPSIRHRVRLRASTSGEADDGFQIGWRSNQSNMDDFLVFAETLCIAPCVVLAIGNVVNLVFPSAIKPLQSGLGNAILAWQIVLLVGAVAIGRAIRLRQWRRFCRGNGTSVNLLERIEKVEEDLRSSTTIVRVLSRQLEKLGIRFRVTRRTLKDPISEAASLAQKNSEATRVLAIREDILEKELREIQMVLLAMQEQQHKQLELILAIGRAGKMIDTSKDSENIKTDNSGGRPAHKKSPGPPAGSRTPANDRP